MQTCVCPLRIAFPVGQLVTVAELTATRRAPDESPIEPGPGATAEAETRSGRNLKADGRDWLARQRQSATCYRGEAAAHCHDYMVAYPRTGEAPAESRSRNMRSRCRCSVCPAIHINSRSWLRSSSTHEPSDPPHRAVLTHHACLSALADAI